MSDDKEYGGMQNSFTSADPFNMLDFVIERKIKQLVNTSALVRVDGCTSTGASAGAGSVSATPMVAQSDAKGHILPMVSIPQMPHARVQGGIAALIIDPVAGDLGIASFCKADSSNIKEGTTEPQRAGSYRAFDQADGVLVATISNKAPEVWIELKQDKTIVIHAPEGCTIETDKSLTIKAGEGVKIDTPQTTITGNLTTTGEKGDQTSLAGTLTSTGDQVAGGISQMNHTHTGVQSGSGSTGKPQ